ncbi:DUF4845 domain-containing protein [Thiohalobacter sp. IOR34]|uniref:DUF4845 domain-containing protein n=1 Tax=Thiohalobacter sp. IOR34 TaxID=3057176 RepID=UPI0025B0250F|nr:DUF4845 domain-containing protein [Thiohalobacter sp. IOR34]WJW76140.1 DUF4845 domain-containing protein [Thiohalobacter sp. IOR34]
MQLRDRQQGMTLIGWLFVLGLIGFFAILSLRLMPNYLEFFKVSSSLESLSSEPGITQKPKTEIRKLLNRRFEVNDVEHVSADDIRISKEDGRLKVRVEYEVRVPVMGNVDAVTRFEKEVEIIRN